ncbi:MAG: hypothetical protein SGBAC_004651 [Bacillariaceae sp.]
MKSPIAFVFLLLVSSVAGYARPSFVTPASLRKSDPQRLLRSQNQYEQPKSRRGTVSSPIPEAVHNTHRVELPGKHKDGPWFSKNQKKAKNNKKSKDQKGNDIGGRAFTYGKVPRCLYVVIIIIITA